MIKQLEGTFKFNRMEIKILSFVFVLFSLASCKQDETSKEIVKESPEISSGIVKVKYDSSPIPTDSVRVTLNYISDLDTIKRTPSDDRFTLLYLTEKDISLSVLEKMIEEDNTDWLLANEVRGYDLRGQDSIQFYFSNKQGLNPKLKGIIDDIVFLKNYDEKGETRIIRNFTHFIED